MNSIMALSILVAQLFVCCFELDACVFLVVVVVVVAVQNKTDGVLILKQF